MGGKGSGNRTKTNPFTAMRDDAVDPDTNARCIRFTLALGDLPDFDHGSVEETQQRIYDFFDICLKHGRRPMVGSFCTAMGMSKSEMWRLVNGDTTGRQIGVTPDTLSLYKKTLALIDTNFEQVLMDAKNPVPAIFYAKSNLGWKEANETTIVHKTEAGTPRLSGKSTEEIAQKYIEIAGADSEPVYEVPVEPPTSEG